MKQPKTLEGESEREGERKRGDEEKKARKGECVGNRIEKKKSMAKNSHTSAKNRPRRLDLFVRKGEREKW